MARFDLMARWYDRLNAYQQADALAEHLGLKLDHVVVDVGGGTGQVGRALDGRFGRWVVVEPSGGMRRKAREKGGVDVVAGVGEHLPVRDASVDRVVMIDAMHHAQGQDEVLKELHRVLRPGGVAVLEEFRMDRWRVKITMGLVERLGMFGSRFDSPRRWVERAKAAGFEAQAVPLNWHSFHLVARKRRNL